MTHHIPCITDSDADRFPAEEPEVISLLTDTEKAVEWLCSDWHDALINDNYDGWTDIGNMIYGASQALIHCKDRGSFEVSRLLRDASELAFHNRLECIKEGKYFK